MAKIKFTKTELKHQQDEEKQFRRFLPTLQLKKQQLQFEVRHSAEQLEQVEEERRRHEESIARFIALFGDRDAADFVTSQVRISRVLRGYVNIAGITVPTFERVEFEPLKWDLFATDWYVDDAVAAVKEAVSLREAARILEEQHALLAAELRSTTQRVNLFEKVKIPECRENIRKIRIMLGDAETSAVARSKIAKRKVALGA